MSVCVCVCLSAFLTGKVGTVNQVWVFISCGLETDAGQTCTKGAAFRATADSQVPQRLKRFNCFILEQNVPGQNGEPTL